MARLPRLREDERVPDITQSTRAATAERSAAPHYDQILQGAIDEGQLVLARQDGSAPAVSPFEYRDRTPSFVGSGVSTTDGGLSQRMSGTEIPEMTVAGVPSMANIPRSAIADMQRDAAVLPEVGVLDVLPSVPRSYGGLTEVPETPVVQEDIVIPEPPEAIIERMTAPTPAPIPEGVRTDNLPRGFTRGADGQGGEFYFQGTPLREILAEERAGGTPPAGSAFSDVTRQTTVGSGAWHREREAAQAEARASGQLSNADYMSMARARGARGSQVSAEANRLRMEDEGRALDRGLRAGSIAANIAATDARAERQVAAAEADARRLELQERRANESIRSSQARTEQESQRIAQRQREIDYRLSRPERQSTFEQRRAAIQGMVERGEISAEEGIEAELRGYMRGSPPAGYATWRDAFSDSGLGGTQSVAEPQESTPAQTQSAAPDVIRLRDGRTLRFIGTDGDRENRNNWEEI